MSTGYYANSLGYPRPGVPTCVIHMNKLMQINMTAMDAVAVEDHLKRRIRRITHLDELTQKVRHEMVRASRMLYELSIVQPDEIRILSSLDKEDLMIIIEFDDHWSTEQLKKTIYTLLPNVREGGPVSPVEADMISKEFVDMMEC